jgi:putative transposase
VISDTHEGLKAAIAQVVTASWRCRVHFIRNALAHVPKGQHSMVAAAIRTVFAHDTAKAAAEAWRHVAGQLRPCFPKLAALMDRPRRTARLYGVPLPALAKVTFNQPARTPQQSS